MKTPTQQQHTLGHHHCPACEQAKRQVLEFSRQDRGKQRFDAVAAVWLAWIEARRRLRPGTLSAYKQYLRPLLGFFGDMKLRDIHIGHIAQYQCERQHEIRRRRGLLPADYADSDGASRINHEVNTLSQILRRDLWQPLRNFYDPLPLPAHGPGMALLPEEEEYWFEVARTRKRWMVAYCCDLISCNTTAGPGEIRHVRVRNLDFERRVVLIEEGVKNEERVRPLPLNSDALWAFRYLLARYQAAMEKAGLRPSPDHFLLYHRAKKKGAPPDPTRPMGSWKTAHYAMRQEVGKRFPRLRRFRRTDFRHTSCTKMLEDPTISYSTIEKLMGHALGSKTKKLYDHIRDVPLRVAVDSMDAGHALAPPAAATAADGRRPARSARIPAARTGRAFSVKSGH